MWSCAKQIDSVEKDTILFPMQDKACCLWSASIRPHKPHHKGNCRNICVISTQYYTNLVTHCIHCTAQLPPVFLRPGRGCSSYLNVLLVPWRKPQILLIWQKLSPYLSTQLYYTRYCTHTVRGERIFSLGDFSIEK